MTGANRGIGQALVEEALGRREPGVASARSIAKAIFDGVEAGEGGRLSPTAYQRPSPRP